jgi:ribosome maturation factor RimP
MPPDEPGKTLQEMVEPTVVGLGYECVEARFVVEAGRRILRVLLDGPNGIPLEACAAVSRALGPVLDASPEMQGRYILEVSSPGLNRPLTKPDHYRRFAGERVKLRLHEKVEGGAALSGILVGLDGDVVTVRTSQGDKRVPLANVARARLHRDADALLRSSREAVLPPPAGT